MSFNNTSIDRYNYNLFKKALDASTERGKIISNNIANVNTANYKRNYVVFEENLKNATGALEMKRTRESHIDVNSPKNEIEVKKDETSSMRQDGNNVNVDLEKVNQAANTLMYNALINGLNNRLSMKRYIINGR
ncbi:flagellar basal body rod protein FlgB [Clostridium malenominatum]|uniref:Flagellar basal body rod protein FlgB n=1 Tax=Clostridium malenominatum TaxID=1539 RepID=A0ABP3U4K0_9CLOT